MPPTYFSPYGLSNLDDGPDGEYLTDRLTDEAIDLDRGIGRLIDALRSSGRLQNTMIIFTSDNGGLSTAEGSPTCNAPLAEGKGWMADGGVRIPLIGLADVGARFPDPNDRDEPTTPPRSPGRSG